MAGFTHPRMTAPVFMEASLNYALAAPCAVCGRDLETESGTVAPGIECIAHHALTWQPPEIRTKLALGVLPIYRLAP